MTGGGGGGGLCVCVCLAGWSLCLTVRGGSRKRALCQTSLAFVCHLQTCGPVCVAMCGGSSAPRPCCCWHAAIASPPISTHGEAYTKSRVVHFCRERATFASTKQRASPLDLKTQITVHFHTTLWHCAAEPTEPFPLIVVTQRLCFTWAARAATTAW